MQKKLLAIPLFFLLGLTLFFSMQDRYSTLIVYAGGTPDEYGNRINSIVLQQYNGTDWVWYYAKAYSWNGQEDTYQRGTTANYAWKEYTASFDFSVLHNKPLRLWVNVRLNQSLAGSAELAVNYTWLKINITSTEGYSLLNKNFTKGNAYAVGTAYWMVAQNYYTWNVTGYPVEGVTYSVVIKYEAYY